MHNIFSKFAYPHILTFATVLIGLSIGSIVLAEIVSGSFTTNTSTNITITNLVLSKPSSVAVGDFMLANVSLGGGLRT